MDSYRHTFTPKSKDKLLCWIFAIVLTLENFNMDASALTRDLSLRQTKVNELLKSLGCKISDSTVSQQKAQKTQMGIPDDDDTKTYNKRATLSTPLTFPAPKR